VERTLLSVAFDVDLDLAFHCGSALSAHWEVKIGKGTTLSRAESRHHRGRAALQRRVKVKKSPMLFRASSRARSHN
jgi:hypothetical protein